MYYEAQVNASVEAIRARFQQSMYHVKFGPFDLHKAKINAFSKPWMGEYNAALDEFKLFRTERGTKNTSDFSIKGQLLRKSNHTDLRYSIRPHYMLFFGFIGINIFLEGGNMKVILDVHRHCTEIFNCHNK